MYYCHSDIMVYYRIIFICYLFFFFKQKTAYEMLRSLVGSEMCIRDRNVRMGSLWMLREHVGTVRVRPMLHPDTCAGLAGCLRDTDPDVQQEAFHLLLNPELDDQQQVIADFLDRSREKEATLMAGLETLHAAATWALPYAGWVASCIRAPGVEAGEGGVTERCSAQARVVLSRLGVPGARAFADLYLPAPNCATRKWALQGLASSFDLKAAKPILMDHLGSIADFLDEKFAEGDAKLMETALNIMKEAKEAAAPHLGMVASFLRHQDKRLVVAALGVLQSQRAKAAPFGSVVSELLSHPELGVRVDALTVLGAMGRQAAPHVAAVAGCLDRNQLWNLSDKSRSKQCHRIRTAALVALVAIGPSAAPHAGVMADCLRYVPADSPSGQERVLALGGLAGLGARSVEPHVAAVAECLEGSLREEEPEVMYCALEVLEMVGVRAQPYLDTIARCLSGCGGKNWSPHICQIGLRIVARLGQCE
eukprot:TRINITY_DN28238_c0_g3_i1.p1 TRINITY_DN28238_c0_g3~~TRINITY_DN28238_c0_g3_i1.p1  ORF type:complete len:479 (+),score=108.46 TRINITY_DN28238_c0_g3_i1:77-1513(+)